MLDARNEVRDTGTDSDRREIEQLLGRAARLLDAKDYRSYIELYEPDRGHYKLISADNLEDGSLLGVMDDDVSTMYDRSEMVDKYWSLEPVRLRHLVTGIEVHFTGDGMARVQAAFAVFATDTNGRIGILATGRYDHKVVRTEGGWRFLDCLAVFDNELLTQAVSYPI